MVAPAVVVFAMAYDNGAYLLQSRNFWAIALWWCVILAVGLRASQARTIEWPALAVGALLSAFALLTLASGFWGSSAERAVNEFNRVSLYVGIFVLTLLSPVRLSRARWCDALALGICAVGVVSLFSRFSPQTFSDRGLQEALPGVTRLSFPVGYWNGLAILIALAIPLLLRTASAPGPTMLRAAAVAVIPAIAVVLYLTSSRGGYVTAAIGAAAFLVLTRERWWPAAAIAVGTIAAAAGGDGRRSTVRVRQSPGVGARP